MEAITVKDRLLNEARELGDLGSDSDIVNQALEFYVSKKKGMRRALGSLRGKATVQFADDWKMTAEEFLSV